MVNRREQSGSERIGQLSSIDPAILVLGLKQGILPWVTDSTFVT
jgi:hypothetical protein